MAHIQLIGVASKADTQGRVVNFPYAYPIIIRELKKTSHSFSHVDTHLDHVTTPDLIEQIAKMEAKIYGISAWTHNYALVKKITQIIRAHHPDSWIIVGGILSGNDDVVINHTCADIVSTGAEGEYILPEILDCLDNDISKLRLVKGITFKDKITGDIIKTPRRPVMTKEIFQSTERPVYEYFAKPIQELVDRQNSRSDIPVAAFPLLIARGCPFPCTFCGHTYGRLMLRKNWELWFNEVEYLVNSFGITGFFGLDNNMFLNEKDVDDYCEVYAARKASFTAIVSMRTTFGHKAMFEKLYNHGIRVVLFGYETGSDKMLANMKKLVKMEKVREVVKSCMDAGVFTHGNFIFGTIGENPDTIKETRDFMLLLEKWKLEQIKDFPERKNTSGYVWSILIPSPTSELYAVARKAGLIKDEEEYLLTLSDEKYQENVKGRNFGIRLNEGAGDVNMSEFTSHAALTYYVRYSFNLVKAKANLLPGAKFNVALFSELSWTAFKSITAYAATLLKDALSRKKGFFYDPKLAEGCAPASNHEIDLAIK